MKTKKQISGLRQLDNNWISGQFDGYEFNAKVYDEPSRFGINDGRVSKLLVTKNGKWVFNYDRGLDIDHPIGVKIAEAIEALKKGGE